MEHGRGLSRRPTSLALLPARVAEGLTLPAPLLRLPPALPPASETEPRHSRAEEQECGGFGDRREAAVSDGYYAAPSLGLLCEGTEYDHRLRARGEAVKPVPPMTTVELEPLNGPKGVDEPASAFRIRSP